MFAAPPSIRPVHCAVWLCGVAAVGATQAQGQGYYQLENVVADGGLQRDSRVVNAWCRVAHPNGEWRSGDETAANAVLNDGATRGDLQTGGVPAVRPRSAGPGTGVVYNPTSSFAVSDGSASAPAVFLFAGVDGVISGWNPMLPAPSPSTRALIAVDRSAQGASYMGLALASTPDGDRLYAADFHKRRVDVFDGDFRSVRLPGAFFDPEVPGAFSPFNIVALDGRIYVAYAMLDREGMEEVTGPGSGYVSLYSTDGRLQKSLIQRGKLNAPWGMTIAPADFGQFSNMLLVGNSGNGRINAYDPLTGTLRGALRRVSGIPIHVDGLWGLAFGNGGPAGPKNVLYFAAGAADEQRGVFGRIDAF